MDLMRWLQRKKAPQSPNPARKRLKMPDVRPLEEKPLEEKSLEERPLGKMALDKMSLEDKLLDKKSR